MKTVNINIASDIGADIEITYVVGQNQHENHGLLDAAEPDDIWFHIDGISSAHVVARVPAGLSRKERGKLIKQGAVLCKNNTHKVVSQKNTPIVYTSCRHVEKTTVPGQVIASSTHTLTL
jgi:predicted ribosome quality control (RQC) complex YloA/Tae2 family protein